jgi:hypothetical protein
MIFKGRGVFINNNEFKLIRIRDGDSWTFTCIFLSRDGRGLTLFWLSSNLWHLFVFLRLLALFINF